MLTAEELDSGYICAAACALVYQLFAVFVQPGPFLTPVWWQRGTWCLILQFQKWVSVLVLEMLTPPLSFLGDTISSKKVVVTDSKIMGKFKVKEKS